MRETTIESEYLQKPRRIWIDDPPGGQSPEALLILLDGEYYVERVGAPEIIAELIAAGEIPLLRVVYVSHIDDTNGKERWTDTFCNESFADCVVKEIMPHVSPDRTFDQKFVGGLSLTGLAAAHVAFRHPDQVDGVLSQSPSVWWNDNWLIHQFSQQPVKSVRFRIVAGTEETAENVTHPPRLFQQTSNLESAQMLRDVLIEQEADVSYEEYEGGHSFECWKQDLPKSLVALLAPEAANDLNHERPLHESSEFDEDN